MTEERCVVCGAKDEGDPCASCRATVTAYVAPEGRAELGAMVRECFSERDMACFEKLSALEQIKVAVLAQEGLACSLVDAHPDVWVFEKGRGSDGQNP